MSTTIIMAQEGGILHYPGICEEHEKHKGGKRHCAHTTRSAEMR